MPSLHATPCTDHRTLVNVESSINEYLTRADWRVNANANQGYSLGGLILNVAGKVTANYWLALLANASDTLIPHGRTQHQRGLQPRGA